MARLNSDYIVVIGIVIALGLIYFYFSYLSQFMIEMRYRRMAQSKRFLVLKQSEDKEAPIIAGKSKSAHRFRFNAIFQHKFFSGIRRLAYKLFLS